MVQRALELDRKMHELGLTSPYIVVLEPPADYSPPKPALPIGVTFRPSVGGGSLVAQYRNRSDKYLSIAVTLRNATLDQRKDLTLNLAPGRVVEHGWAEGWTYMSGEVIWVYHADYEPLSVKVP